MLGAFQDGVLTGLFDFQITAEDRYLELIIGLSRSRAAYEALAEYLQANYSGFQADFILNPANTLMRDMLLRRGAAVYEEQQRMVLSNDSPAVDTDGIEPLSGRRMDQYLAMHNTDCYWTREKVAEASDRYSVYLAVEDDVVVGYIDMTNCYEVNEPADVLVKKEHRGRGWGKKLLAKAIEMNRPKGMALLVDVDNAPAIALYESAGFVKVQGENNQTATWNIG